MRSKSNVKYVNEELKSFHTWIYFDCTLRPVMRARIYYCLNKYNLFNRWFYYRLRMLYVLTSVVCSLLMILFKFGKYTWKQRRNARRNVIRDWGRNLLFGARDMQHNFLSPCAGCFQFLQCTLFMVLSPNHQLRSFVVCLFPLCFHLLLLFSPIYFLFFFWSKFNQFLMNVWVMRWQSLEISSKYIKN